jgi:hypothetical protein
MTDRIALILALALVALGTADAMLNDGAVLLFLARKFLDLMEWVEFWR